MNTENEAQPKTISTPTILVLIVGLGLLGYMLIQPMFAPKDNTPAPLVSKPTGAPVANMQPNQSGQPMRTASNTQPNQSGQPMQTVSNTSQSQTGAVAALPTTAPVVKENVGLSDRDPFAPSGLYLVRQSLKQTETSQNPVKPQKVEEPSKKPEPVIKKTTASTGFTAPTPSVSAKPAETPLAWKGTVGSGSELVVMIQRNNRTYMMHLGEVLPGTAYILGQVTADSVLLVSPTDQKRLYKKKEAKING